MQSERARVQRRLHQNVFLLAFDDRMELDTIIARNSASVLRFKNGVKAVGATRKVLL